jgi:hypothetical protein
VYSRPLPICAPFDARDQLISASKLVEEVVTHELIGRRHIPGLDRGPIWKLLAMMPVDQRHARVQTLDSVPFSSSASLPAEHRNAAGHGRTSIHVSPPLL